MTIRLAITAGDPAGVGPQVVDAAVRAVVSEVPDLALLVIGPAGQFEQLQADCAPAVQLITQAVFAGPRGVASAEGGRAAWQAFSEAVALARAGQVDGLVTAPISKEAWALAGISDRGHTAVLARSLAQGPVAMSFLGPRLRVVLATEHVPLCRIWAGLSPERIVTAAALLSDSLAGWLGPERPHLALAGLNPHAGEKGLLGDEEGQILEPAVALAREQGLWLDGPFPPDTLFRRAWEGAFAGVVALYHDQGLIPVKMLGFDQTVNVTLGLSVVRTSPSHGTAFDRVGQDDVSAAGMLAALRLAVSLVWARARSANR